MSDIFGHPVLAVRIHAGFNAASFLAGLLALTDQTAGTASAYLCSLFPEIPCGVAFGPRQVNGIAGFSARLLTEPEDAHRHPGDILEIYAKSRLSDAAKKKAEAVWRVLAEAEGRVHGAAPHHVHFHEVGRMSNILAIGLAAEFLTTLEPAAIHSSPIPLGDGSVKCAHGMVPYPAPAMFQMLEGVAVRGYAGEGEPVTPTGLAVLKGFGARFGAWPRMTPERIATVFSDAYFEGVPNGTLFAMGPALPKDAD